MKNSHQCMSTLLLQPTFLYTVQGLHNIEICACCVCYEHSICHKLVIFRRNELKCFLLINNGHKFMSKEWVTWKWSRTGGMGENLNLLKKWMKLGGNVPPTMLHNLVKIY